MTKELEALTNKYDSLCRQYAIMKAGGFINTAVQLKIQMYFIKSKIEILKAEQHDPQGN